MTKFFFIISVLLSGLLNSQTTDTGFYHLLVIQLEKEYALKLRSDSLEQLERFRNRADTGIFIFGCSCCGDTIERGFDRSRKYILTKNKTELSAYKHGQKKWLRSTLSLFGDAEATITCIEFFKVKKMMTLRVYSDYPRVQHVTLESKNGRTICKTNSP